MLRQAGFAGNPVARGSGSRNCCSRVNGGETGITGWAQVNYGYAATIEEMGIKLEYDLYYIKHRNLLLDLVILIRTVGTVVGLRGQ